jgi:hypothetical protein
MNACFLAIFFGSALVIGIYFVWVLFRAEMDGKPKAPPVDDDFGFAPAPTPPTRRRTLFVRPGRHPKLPIHHA